jgi:hypothetical protein
MTCDVLFFAEDPGAANFMSSLPATLAAKGHDSAVLASGHAVTQFGKLGIACQAISAQEDACDLIGRHRPKVVAVGTSARIDTMGLRLIDQIRDRAIASVGLVDGLAAFGHRFRGPGSTPTAYAPDWLVVPDPATRENYLGVGFASERVIVGGHPHYDRVRAERRQLDMTGKRYSKDQLFPREAQDRPVVMFCTEISESPGHADHRARPDDTLKGFSGTTRRAEVVLEEFLAAVKDLHPEPFLILRLHPKTPKEEFAKYLDAFDMVSQASSSLPIAYAVDLVVGLSTILLEEAVLLDTPALSIIRRPEEANWLAGISGGAIPVVLYREEIGPAMRRLLHRGPTRQQVENALPAGATTRVTALLESRLGENMECLQ